MCLSPRLATPILTVTCMVALPVFFLVGFSGFFFGISDDLATVADKLVQKLCDELGFESRLSPENNRVL